MKRKEGSLSFGLNEDEKEDPWITSRVKLTNKYLFFSGGGNDSRLPIRLVQDLIDFLRKHGAAK